MISKCGLKLGNIQFSQANSKCKPKISQIIIRDRLKRPPQPAKQASLSKSLMCDQPHHPQNVSQTAHQSKPIRTDCIGENSKKLSIQGLPLIQDKLKFIYVIKQITAAQQNSKILRSVMDLYRKKKEQQMQIYHTQLQSSPRNNNYSSTDSNVISNKSRNKFTSSSFTHKKKIHFPTKIFQTHEKSITKATYSINSIREHSEGSINEINDNDLYVALNVSKEEPLQLVPKININYGCLLSLQEFPSVFLIQPTLL